MKNLIKPAKLKVGDTIAAVTLSWGGAGKFPYRYKIGKERLESEFGIKVVPTKHALRDEAWIRNNPQARAADLMDAFLDSHIKGIIANVGGDDSLRMLPYIDFDVIRCNPKVFLGFSDTTVTHFMCLKAGLSSFYGPMLMTAFAENIQMHAYSRLGVQKTLFSNKALGQVPQNAEGWTADHLDWETPENQLIQRQLKPSTGWKFVGNTQQMCQGRLIGGCVEGLQFILATGLWPQPQVWEHSILFLEIAEQRMRPVDVARFMRNLAAQGILEKVSGVLFSRPGEQHTIEEAQLVAYEDALLQVFAEYQLPQVPIVTRMDFGHTDPMWTLPYGALTEINPMQKTVSILESSVV
jgi:muramoyltetrapeptide carboxypeptidase LdcA involved in peptidoglycan recycling